MTQSDQYLFIVNPISGKGKGKAIIPLIEKIFTRHQISFLIRITAFAGEAKSLAEKGILEGYSHIIAVGGDGTVNEVAGKLAGTNVIFGVIPIGSGNGLAREMNIPLDSKAAIQNLLTGTVKKIDTGSCNGHFFVCTAGIGFDAHMAHTFLNLENRGLLGYVRTFIQEFFTYKTQKYRFIADSKEFEEDAFLVTIANCRQWGNEFYISPLSKPDDGQFEICILKKFPLILFPILLFRILTKSIHKSSYFQSLKIKQSTIISSQPIRFHADGETESTDNKLEITLNPKSLFIVVKY